MKEIRSDLRPTPAQERIILDAVRAIRGPEAEASALRALQRLREEGLIVVSDDVREAAPPAPSGQEAQLAVMEPASLRPVATEAAIAFHRRADDDERFASHVIAGALGLVQAPRLTYMYGAMGIAFPVAQDPAHDLMQSVRAAVADSAARLMELFQSAPIISLAATASVLGGAVLLISHLIGQIPDHLLKIGGDVVRVPLRGGGANGKPPEGGEPRLDAPANTDEAFQRYLECVRKKKRAPRTLDNSRTAEITVQFPYDEKTRHSCTIKTSYATPSPTVALVQLTVADSGVFDIATGERIEFDGEMVRENCHKLIEESKECVRVSSSAAR